MVDEDDIIQPHTLTYDEQVLIEVVTDEIQQQERQEQQIQVDEVVEVQQILKYDELDEVV